MIELQNVSVKYPNYSKNKQASFALKEIYLSIKQGDIYLITGLNSSGKSTLLHLLSGVIPQMQKATVSGTITRQATIGVVLEDSDTFLMPTVYEELEFILINAKFIAADIHNTITDISSKLYIGHLLKRQIQTLSGGERQRVALAAAMIIEPDILILDEPLSQIDKDFHSKIIELLLGKTVIIASLDPSIYLPLQPEILYLNEGVLVNSLEQPTSAEQSEYTKLPEQQIILQAQGITFAYGENQIFTDLDIELHTGEIVAILGENGAGKSTLLQILTGTIKPQCGQVVINGKHTGELTIAEATEHIGMVWQNPDHQMFQNTIRKELEWSIQLRYGKNHPLLSKIDEYLKEFQLESIADEHPYSLTRTVRQIVALASAVIVEPKLLLLDEPTQNLDYYTTERFMNMVVGLANKGTAILMVTHNSKLADKYASRVIHVNRK